MPTETIRWTFDQLLAADLGRHTVWASPRTISQLPEQLRSDATNPLHAMPPNLDHLVVFGGGTTLDEAKTLLLGAPMAPRLIAVPTLWGSGADASPIAVVHRDGKKVIHKDDAIRPTVRVVWPEVAKTLPLSLARWGCGDTVSHGIEAFLSPLANDDLRGRLAGLATRMAALPLAVDPQWFDVSAEACALQADCGVGLVHGIAHTLEIPLREKQPDIGWSHARLCSLFLWPVMRLIQMESPKVPELVRQFEFPWLETMNRARDLFDENDFANAMPTLETLWTAVLRDPCTRMGGMLTRPRHLEFFQSRGFL